MKTIKPYAKYVLTNVDCCHFCNSIKNIKFPNSFVSNLRKNVIENDNKIIGLKSHDCHVIIQQLLPCEIRAFMNRDIALNNN